MGFISEYFDKKHEKKIREALSKYSEKEKVTVVLSRFDEEVMNGGLCQFFINDSRFFAPYVSECLLIIGAKEINEKFLSFVEKYNINLNDLSSFKSRTLEEFSAQYKRYPFDEFDKFYYSQQEESSVYQLVKKYIDS